MDTGSRSEAKDNWSVPWKPLGPQGRHLGSPAISAVKQIHIFSPSIQHVIITEIYRQEYADHSSESRLHDYNGTVCS